jgi:hypothetical protein
MKPLKPDDEVFLDALQRSALHRPPKLSAAKRAELHRALQSAPSSQRSRLRFALLTSTLALCCILLLTRQHLPTTRAPAAELTTVPQTVAPASSLDWDMPEHFNTRLARTQAKQQDRWQSFKQTSVHFKSRTKHLKSKLQKLRKELS